MEKAKKTYKIIFCIINSLIGLFTTKFHYPLLDIYGNNDEVYLEPFHITDIFIVIAFFIIWYLLLYIVERLVNKYKKDKKVFDISNKKLFIISFITLLILWAPYYLSFFPGGVYSDTYEQFLQAKNGIIGNGYSVFYSLLIRFLYFISFKNTTITFGLMTILQVLLFMVIISYSIVWLKNKNVNKIFIILALVFYAINPRIPIYALSLWKDSLFNIFLLLYTLFVFDIIFGYKDIKKINNAIIYSVLCILVSMFRNNGLYIVLIMSIVILIKYIKEWKNSKIFYCMTICCMLVIFLTYNVLFKSLGYGPPYHETIGVQLQQIGYAVTHNEIDDNLKNEIEKFTPVDNFESHYFPLIVDGVKFSKEFNDDYLESHKLEFWMLYLKVFFKYPKDAVTGFLYNNVGYWNYYLTCVDAGSDSLLDFYDITVSLYPEDGDLTDNIDIFKNIFGFSLKEPISSMASVLNNCAIGFLISFISIYIMILRKNKEYLVIYIPLFLILIALLFGTPVAFSSRYIIYSILFIPLSIIIPFIEQKKNKKSKS